MSAAAACRKRSREEAEGSGGSELGDAEAGGKPALEVCGEHDARGEGHAADVGSAGAAAAADGETAPDCAAAAQAERSAHRKRSAAEALAAGAGAGAGDGGDDGCGGGSGDEGATHGAGSGSKAARAAGVLSGRGPGAQRRLLDSMDRAELEVTGTAAAPRGARARSALGFRARGVAALLRGRGRARLLLLPLLLWLLFIALPPALCLVACAAPSLPCALCCRALCAARPNPSVTCAHTQRARRPDTRRHRPSPRPTPALAPPFPSSPGRARGGR